MKYVYTLLIFSTFIFTVPVFGQSDILDQDRIRLVLMQELIATSQCDFDMMKKFWHPSPRIYYSSKTDQYNMVINGWSDLRRWTNEQEEDCVPGAETHNQCDHSFRIKDNMAVVKYTEDEVRQGQAILQRHQGRWKIIHKSIRESTSIASK